MPATSIPSLRVPPRATLPDLPGLSAAPGELAPALVLALATMSLGDNERGLSCGISAVVPGGAPEAVAATSDLPVRADWLQHELRQGPLVNSGRAELVVSNDLAADDRWRDFGRMCVSVLGLRSMVSVRVPVAGAEMARLTFFAEEGADLSRLDLDRVLLLARTAAPGVQRVLERCRCLLRVPSDFSRTAVALSTVMSRHRCSSRNAWNLLCTAAVERRTSVLETALALVSGSQPSLIAERVGGPEMWWDSPAQPGSTAG